MKPLLAILGLSLSALVLSQTGPCEITEKDGKRGLYNPSSDKTILKNKNDYLNWAFDDLYTVCEKKFSDNTAGVINSNGEWVVPQEYDMCFAWPSAELIEVGFIDDKGKRNAKLYYPESDSYGDYIFKEIHEIGVYNNRQVILVEKRTKNHGNRMAMIELDGTEILAPKYQSIFWDIDKIIVYKGDKRFYLAENGKLIAFPKDNDKD